MSHPRYQDLEHSLANHGSFGATDLVARATDGKYFVKNIIHLNRMAEALTRDDLYQFGSIVKIRHPNLARVREALIVGSSKTDKEDIEGRIRMYILIWLQENDRDSRRT